MQFQGRPITQPGPSKAAVGVSPETLAQQFCLVAADMRLLLKATEDSAAKLSNSIELQQQMVAQIKIMTEGVSALAEGLGELMRRMEEFMQVTREFIEQNEELRDDLTENSIMVAAAFRPRPEDMDELRKRTAAEVERLNQDRKARRVRRRPDRRSS